MFEAECGIRKLLWVCAAVVLIAATVAGCSTKTDSNRPKTVAASAVVTLDGKAVQGAQVTLVPEMGGNAAFGTSDGNGKVRFMTFTADDGAVPGCYQVSVLKSKVDAPIKPSTGKDDDGDDEDVPEGRKVPVTHLLPKKYASPTTSGLTATIAETDPNEIQLPLKSR